jgi:hypothetical protein
VLVERLVSGCRRGDASGIPEQNSWLGIESLSEIQIFLSRERWLVKEITMESLILAQDERLRRA